MKASFIINPNSGPKSTIHDLEKSIENLKEKGIKIEKYISRSSTEARKLSKKAVQEKLDLVIVAGGDGTINEVSNSLINTNIPLAIIPTGTANVFAKELGIPTRNFLKADFINKCTEIISDKNIKEVDVGKITFKNKESRHFVMWCGIGLDAKLTEAKKTPPESFFGRTLNYLKWVLAIIKLYLRFSEADVTYKLNGEIKKEKLIQMLISNGSIYANYFIISEKAKIDDGKLDFLYIKNRNKFSLMVLLLKSLFTKNLASDSKKQIKKISIESKDPLPIHVDAETCGTTPAEIEIIPKALRVIVPK